MPVYRPIPGMFSRPRPFRQDWFTEGCLAGGNPKALVPSPGFSLVTFRGLGTIGLLAVYWTRSPASSKRIGTLVLGIGIMGGSERQREIRRRRKRRSQLVKLKKRAEKATKSEKAVLATKLRRSTSGAEELIKRLGLEAE